MSLSARHQQDWTKYDTPNSGRVDSNPASRLGPVVATAGVSASWFYWYAITGSRSEWYDIMMDYCHHKRTQYGGAGFADSIGRGFMRLFRIMPK